MAESKPYNFLMKHDKKLATKNWCLNCCKILEPSPLNPQTTHKGFISYIVREEAAHSHVIYFSLHPKLRLTQNPILPN